ncbi:MAG: hypothetical protein RMJ87_06425 [Cytophagales bacterium]|nr:DUF5004 domain-containing protein [Bernardetiaceae bacterium]MDW8204647.1 hypothetical protein [Cytophagales bacterium]
MKKRFIICLTGLLIVLSITGCADKNNASDTINLLFTILSQRGGTWRVNSATFGNEEAPLNMFADYRITFRPDGSYQVTNPAGAPSFTRNASGKYMAFDRLLTFDDGVTVAREISTGALNPNRLLFEFDVTLPGKATTTYRFELVR